MEGRYRISRYAALVLFFGLLFFVAGSTAAQEDAPRDAKALAARFLGYEGEAIALPLTPIYQVGDTMEFWVGKNGSETPVRVSATLAAAAPSAYLWVEEGIANPGSLQQRAGQFSQIFDFYRQRDNYRESTRIPSVGAITDPTDLLPIPDVDNDPHLYILFTTDLREDREAIFNPIDSLPVEFAPYSNQHEMLYMNTSALSSTALTDPIYASIIVRGIYRWIMTANIPEQPLWLTETFNWALLFNIQQASVAPDNLSAYLQAPNTPLIQPPSLTTQAQVIGGQQLFLAYLLQRYGDAIYTDLIMQTGSGIAPLDAVLEKRDIIDPATGAPVTARDAFADFVLANALNIPFGDGRYVQGILQLPEQISPTSLTLPAEQPGLSVSQFGVQYYVYTTPNAESVSITFNGSPSVALLPMPVNRDPADRFYWSGRGDNRNPTLTRAVDLSSVDSATLTFDAWYDLASGWNYGYVSVSTDEGAMWQPLSATHSSDENRYGAAYGAGFTGISNTTLPRPFPILGVVIGGDGLTATDVSPGSPAAAAGIRPGDAIIGYGGEEWIGTPNILGLLAEYAPGDTLNLLIRRGSERLDLPVVLGAHPTRIVEPAPIWLAQTVDLTPYAGQEILLRFEAVTLPGQEDGGFAVDNLSIAEIDWNDDAEDSDDSWTLDGWQQVDNQLTQLWQVQAVMGGTATSLPRVQRLVDANDEGAGDWRVSLGAGESLLLAISGVNDNTTERATYTLGVKRG